MLAHAGVLMWSRRVSVVRDERVLLLYFMIIIWPAPVYLSDDSSLLLVIHDKVRG